MSLLDIRFPFPVGRRYLDQRVSLRENDVTGGPGRFLTWPRPGLHLQRNRRSGYYSDHYGQQRAILPGHRLRARGTSKADLATLPYKSWLRGPRPFTPLFETCRRSTL